LRKNLIQLLKVFVIYGVLLLSMDGCHQGLKSDLPVILLKIKNHEIHVEVANRRATQMAGLMFRKHMDSDNGMLFVFSDSQQRSFWMKNTLIPLSIAYLDEKGVIINVLEMPPQTEETFLSKGPAKFALEMNSGWFENNSLKAGDIVEGVLNAPKAED
jgi:uncharacterized membrane protein (UPF0127 family)